MTSRPWTPGFAVALALALPCVGFQASGSADRLTIPSALALVSGALPSDLLDMLDRAITAGRFPSTSSVSLDRTQVWSLTTSH